MNIVGVIDVFEIPLHMNIIGLCVIEVFENNRVSDDTHKGTHCTVGTGATWWYNSSNKRIKLNTSSV